MSDTYSSFAELAQNETEGEDFEVEVLADGRDPEVAIIAPHGGSIECHTCLLAKAIAGDDLTCYAFRGIKRTGNQTLHITSHRFDEPRVRELVASAILVLAIHGKAGKDSFVMIGGLDLALVNRLGDGMERLQLEVREPPLAVAGEHPDNICNQGRDAVGAQLELSMGLRSMLASDEDFRRGFVKETRRALLAGRSTWS